MTSKIAFTLPAEALEGASEAILLGDFNNWNPENAPKLEKQPDGSFKAFAHLEEGHTYHYRFLLDNERWVNDYNAESYVAIPGLYVDNCVITVPVSQDEQNTPGVLADESVDNKTEATDTIEATAVKAKGPKKASPKTKTRGADTTAKKAKAAGKKAETKKEDKPEKAPKATAKKAAKTKE
jgi:hypothetical protein